jgi:amino acid transporter
MIVIEKNYGFLLSKNAVAGGEYAFTFKSFGRAHALVCGWFLALAYISIVPLNATALALIAKAMFPGVLEKGYLYSVAGYDIYVYETLLASAALIVFGYLNIRGIKFASFIQTIMTLFLVGIVLFMGCFFLRSPNIDMNIFNSHFNTELIDWSGVLKVLAIAPWAYIGFDCIPQVAEEFNFPAKKASTMAIASILIGCLIYNLLNIITASTFTKKLLESGATNWATGDSIELLFGKLGLYMLGMALLMAIVAGINGFYMASSRLIFSMARAKALPEWFAATDDKSNTPKNAIIFVMIISMAAPWIGRAVLGWVVDMSSVGAAIGYGYTSLSAYVQAKKERNKFIQYTGVFGGIASTCFLALLLVPIFPGALSAPCYIALLVWVVLGLTFYKFYGNEYNSLCDIELKKLILGE